MRLAFVFVLPFALLVLSLACGGVPAERVIVAAPTASEAPAEAPAPSSEAPAPRRGPSCDDAWYACVDTCGDNSDCFMECPHCGGCTEGEDCDTCPAREEACMSECGARQSECRSGCDQALSACNG